ncbi:MAG: DNA recombination protein RmuC [Sphingobacteriales bacterium]|nr:MAG: DNA recombination protein RmuC [Sphingobacteriales bacterium]TAF83386.1 MAG: DNA recombination protein RmuC [Sphingobacteriales bacterium]
MDIGLILIALVLLLVAVFLFVKRPKAIEGFSQADFIALKTSLAVAEQQVKNATENEQKLLSLQREEKLASDSLFIARIEKLEADKLAIAEQLTNEKKRMSQAEESFKAQREKLIEQKQFVDESHQKFKTEFENVANKILKEKTAEFTEVNKTNLDTLLNPLKENIKAFEDKVDKVYKTEADERNVLKGTIDQMMLMNKTMSIETQNLTKALKGDNKKQGNWGEMVLDKLLEGSGLIDGINYAKQQSFTGDNGNRLQPDVLILLPEKKHIVIDAKVSLVAYEKLVNNDAEEDRETLTKLHVNSIKTHINGLSAKNYHDLYGINSPEFVLLFVPIESSYAIAVQYDQELFDYAWKKRVVVVTPSTLLATLKTVASMWKQEQQTKNAIDIATKAGQLYDKFVGFVADLQKIGEHIDKSQKVYGDAMGKLNTGNGNLVGRVENLKKLGAKTDKNLDAYLLED